MKLTLKKPVQNGSVTVTELTFREEMVAGDVRGIIVRTEMTFDDFLKIGGRLCAQPDQVMNSLGMADMLAIIGFVAPLFAGGPSTAPAP